MKNKQTPSSESLSEREMFAAFLLTEDCARQTDQIATEMGWKNASIVPGGVEAAIEALQKAHSPQIILVEIADGTDPASAMMSLGEVCEAGTLAIAIGGVNDVHVYRDLLAGGVQDYLVRPTHLDDLRASLMKAESSLHQKADMPQQGRGMFRSVAVIGAQGGVGTSTIASSLAWLIADATHMETVFMDLDLNFASPTMIFDLEPVLGLTEKLAEEKILDPHFMERAFLRVNESLTVAAFEARLRDRFILDERIFALLEKELRYRTDYLVLDMPRAIAVTQPAILNEVDDVILVADQTLMGTREALRILSWLYEQLPGVQASLVVNMAGRNPGAEVSHQDFEQTIERTIDLVIPYDAGMATRMVRRGEPAITVAEGKTKHAMLPLLSLVKGIEDAAEAPPPSLWERLGLTKKRSS